MSADDKTLREKIAAYIAGNPDRTSHEIARGIEADHWDAQHEILLMLMADILDQVGMRDTADGKKRPIYRLIKAQGDSNGQ